jgi:hypothetical protein
LICHISRGNCPLTHIIEGKIDVKMEATGRKERRCKQLPDDLKETAEYWKLKEETLDYTLWRTRFGRGYGPVARLTAE